MNSYKALSVSESSDNIIGHKHSGLISDFISIIVFWLIFYISAYFSVSEYIPTSIPVHHDDYTNYAAGSRSWSWSWIRPLSNSIIYVLTQMGPEWLIWSVRILTVTFVFWVWKLLCEFYRPAYYWVELILFGIVSFSTPIIVEYARYTGMITHLISGCLGIAAVYYLFREIKQPKQGWIYLSVLLIVLSASAKEDFVLLYSVSLVYSFIFHHSSRKHIVVFGGFGLAVCGILIGGAKFMAASRFLGVSDAGSTYYVDPSLGGILRTVWLYLVGAEHPAMTSHGLLVAGIFLFCFSAVIVLVAWRKCIPKAAYFVAALLSVMAPYSVLPNHVNAYYEFIWLSLLIGGAYLALTELVTALDKSSLRLKKTGPMLILLIVAGSFIIIDYQGRRSIASWYDNVALNNEKIINQLRLKTNEINEIKNVCILNANSFSPWYMHGGDYLETVVGLDSKWFVFVDPSSPIYSGMVLGANSSNGRTIVVSDQNQIAAKCLFINLESIK